MRVLILTQYYTPEPLPRPAELAHGLIRLGHTVFVLTGYPNYPQGKVYAGYRQRLWQQEQVKGVDIGRVPSYADHSRSRIKRAWNLVSFAVSAALIGPVTTPKADVIFAYAGGLPLGIAAWALSIRHRAPLVFAVHDLWPETLVATGALHNRTLLALLRAFERWVYRRSAAVTVLTEGQRRCLIDKGIAADKVTIVPNWADDLLYQPVPVDIELAEQLGLAGRFNVMFAGNLGIAQGLDTVLDAAALCQTYPNVQFVLVGDGVDKSRLEQAARDRGLTNVRFLNRWPAESMLRLYAMADVLLVHLCRDPIYRFMVPSKTQAYLAVGKPILMAVEGEAAELIERTRSGLTCKSEDPGALAAQVLRFYKMDAGSLHAFGDAARTAFEQQFRQDDLLVRYEQLFLSLIASGGR